MNTPVMTERIAEMSPRLKARMAGVLFLFLVLTSTFTEFFARGRLSFAAHIAAGVIEVSCMIAVTLLFSRWTGAFLCSRRPSTSWQSPFWALCRNLNNSSINGGFRGANFSVRSAG
jgi:hypothetical protein